MTGRSEASRGREGAPVVGVLGGGQLAAMMAQAAEPLGVRLRVLDPTPDPSAARFAEHVRGSLSDEDSLTRLARDVSCITLETENVPLSSLSILQSRGVAVHPGRQSLDVCSDRLHEKRFLGGLGIPVAPYRPARSAAELVAAVHEIGGPVIAKTRRFGYDGRGQVRIDGPAAIADAWAALGANGLVVESVVPFRRELSLVSVRSLDGAVLHYPLVENVHVAGILRRTVAPAANVTAALRQTAESWSNRMLSALGHVGVLTIEFFETAGGLLVNELAPRVHNSGHWTIEGAVCSQFENHVRAVLGRPLRSTRARTHAVMLNLIGEMPDRSVLNGHDDAHVHAYGKAPRPGRKLGHVTLTDENPSRLLARAGRLAEAVAGQTTPDATPTHVRQETIDMDRNGPACLSRRQLIHSVVAGGVATLATVLPLRAAAPVARRPRTPDEALRRLMDGNARFVAGRAEGLRRSLDRVRETADGQAPFAAILGCADSRVPPELLFDQGVGDLFVVRVAGNVVTPEEIASLEFGVAALGAQLILVLGHTSCGAVKAALEGGPAPGQITTLYQHFQPALSAAGGDGGRAVELNARQQRDVLRAGSPVLRDAVRAGTLAVEGAVYDLATGRVRMIGESTSHE